MLVYTSYIYKVYHTLYIYTRRRVIYIYIYIQNMMIYNTIIYSGRLLETLARP